MANLVSFFLTGQLMIDVLKIFALIDLFRLYTLFSQYRSCANTLEVCSLKRGHAGIFMLACPLFNEQNKEPILLRLITRFVLGKQNVIIDDDLIP